MVDLQTGANHAVFLVHGLWGNKAHFWFVEEQLRKAHPSLNIHSCSVNEGNRTYDGIDVGGDRVLEEIEETLRKWKEEGVVIKKFSIVGYSLGGLVSRYVVGLLYARGLFENITPINFTTFASPHLGIRHIDPGWLHSIANRLGPKLLSASGRQMFIADRPPKPLLVRMAEKDSIFIRGLSQFKNRIAYANIMNDRSVPYHTAAISQYDPYLDMTKINLSYLPSYAPIILHPTHPIIPLSKPKIPSPPTGARRWLFPIGIAILIPIWAIFFVLASLYQSFFSSRRIRQHLLQNRQDQHNQPQTHEDEEVEERGLSGAVQDAFEDVVDNATIFSPTEDHDEFFNDVSEETTLLDANGHANGGDSEKAISVKRDEYRLALAEEQMAMLRGLRSLPWQTFGVHINKTMHSHAAIIRRTKWRKGLEEGEVVIQHWLQTQFEA